MKNIVIVNLLDISPYFYEKIGGLEQIDRIKNYIKTLPMVNNTVFFLKEDLDIPFKKVIKRSWTEEIFMETMAKLSSGFDHIFYFFGDAPLLDSELSKSMFEDHINYYAEYTFADGFPYGLTPEIIDVEIIKALKTLSAGSSNCIKRDTIFNIVKKDINSFELETKIAEKDQRLKRVSLTTDTKRNFNQLRRIVNLGGLDAESVTEIIESHGEILFMEPSYITLEISKDRVQDVSYLPDRSVKDKFMTLENLDCILSKIKNYSDDATFSFIPEYEPDKHPMFKEVIKKITDDYGFDLYIETSGIGWSKDLKEEIIRNSKIKIIITLDAIDPYLYRQLRGDGQAEAEAFVKEIIPLMNDRIWIQATRMKDNESDMEPFYRYWQEFTEQIIIQKYSNYNETLPDLKVADLSPLKRFPCWHLKRDLHINTEGEALLCFNDIKGETVLGSLILEGIEVIMDRKKEYYTQHLKCEYTEFCRKCDEYYTFNF